MTTSSCVFDASVIIKLLYLEEKSALALDALNYLTSNSLNAYEPNFLKIEVFSSLQKKASFSELSQDDLKAAVTAYKQMPFTYVEEDWFILERALKYSSTIGGRVVYDSIYLALAFQMRCNLITADEKFVNIVSPKFQNVFLLQDWELALRI